MILYNKNILKINTYFQSMLSKFIRLFILIKLGK